MYKPTWDYRFQWDYDVRHLVPHEFLGIARMSDQDYQLSSKIFPPSNTALNFLDNALVCTVSSYNMRRSAQRPPVLNNNYGWFSPSSRTFYGTLIKLEEGTLAP